MNRQELARRLDELDPDWPSKFLSTDQAARFYREELEIVRKPGFVVHSSPFEPPTIIDAVNPDPDEDTQ